MSWRFPSKAAKREVARQVESSQCYRARSLGSRRSTEIVLPWSDNGGMGEGSRVDDDSTPEETADETVTLVQNMGNGADSGEEQ